MLHKKERLEENVPMTRVSKAVRVGVERVAALYGVPITEVVRESLAFFLAHHDTNGIKDTTVYSTESIAKESGHGE